LKLSLKRHTYAVFHDIDPQFSNHAFLLRKARLVPKRDQMDREFAVFRRFRVLTLAATLRIAQANGFVTLQAWRSIHFVIFLRNWKPPVN
jgi:hypothetical protein